MLSGRTNAESRGGAFGFIFIFLCVRVCACALGGVGGAFLLDLPYPLRHDD